MRLMFIGDVVGRPGRSALKRHLGRLRESHRVDVVVANGENAAGGAGLTGAIARELMDYGVDAITLGDHVWDQKGFDREIGDLERVCRPANLPEVCPGRTFLELQTPVGLIAIFTVLGRQYMKIRAECPFLTADGMLAALSRGAAAILVEIHAEATSEKIAMGWHLDGRATVVVGTHTHVQTADSQILPRGTAYLTDAGMTGPHASVLGREVEPVVSSFLDGMPRRFKVAEEDLRINGLVVEVDPETRLARSVKAFSEVMML